MVAADAYTCQLGLLSDVMFGVNLTLDLASPSCPSPLHISQTDIALMLQKPIAAETDIAFPPLEYDVGGVVALRLPRPPLASLDWEDAGLAAPIDASKLQMWVGTHELYVPPQDRLILVTVPPGEGRGLRVTVEIAGLFNVTSDGLAPTDPVLQPDNSSIYVNYDRPVILAVEPPVVVFPDIWWPSVSLAERDAHALRTLRIVGTDLGVTQARMSALYIGEIPCTIVHVNASVTLCTNWNVTAAALRMGALELEETPLDIRMIWLGVETNYTGLLKGVPRPQALRVAPLQVQAGTKMLVYGKYFYTDTSCLECDASIAPILVMLGSDRRISRCDQVILLSDTGLTCITPEVDPANIGYPTVSVSIQNLLGVQSYSNNTVVFPERLGVQMPDSGLTQGAPSGSGTSFLSPLAPDLVVEVQGKGKATCWVDILRYTRQITSQSVGVGLGISDVPTLVGNTSMDIDLGAVASSLTLKFTPVGVKGASTVTAQVVARCKDSKGELSTSAELRIVRLPGMSAAWIATTVTPILGPQAPISLPSLSAVFQWYNATSNVTSHLSQTPECQALIVPASVSLPLGQTLSDASRLALSSAAATFTSISADGSRIAMNFSMSLFTAELGASLQLSAECLWAATGERTRMAAYALSVASIHVDWIVEGFVVILNQQLEQLPLTPVYTSGSIVPMQCSPF
jgi:hypothetical protein